MKLSDEHIVIIAKALADKTRLRILNEIARGKSITCGEAEKIAGLSQPTVSHHLKVLYDAGLLITQKNGRHVNIAVNKKALDDFSKLIADSMKG
jgi:ArsR family transcriptional regulator, arsenate/arsenite/antimonite-responsive transcriptional repressor